MSPGDPGPEAGEANEGRGEHEGEQGEWDGALKGTLGGRMSASEENQNGEECGKDESEPWFSVEPDFAKTLFPGVFAGGDVK